MSLPAFLQPLIRQCNTTFSPPHSPSLSTSRCAFCHSICILRSWIPFSIFGAERGNYERYNVHINLFNDVWGPVIKWYIDINSLLDNALSSFHPKFLFPVLYNIQCKKNNNPCTTKQPNLYQKNQKKIFFFYCPITDINFHFPPFPQFHQGKKKEEEEEKKEKKKKKVGISCCLGLIILRIHHFLPYCTCKFLVQIKYTFKWCGGYRSCLNAYLWFVLWFMPCDGHAMCHAMPFSHEGSGTAALSKGGVKGIFHCVIVGFILQGSPYVV